MSNFNSILFDDRIHLQNFPPGTSVVIDLSADQAVSESNAPRTAKAGGVRNLQVTVDIQTISHTDRPNDPSKIGVLVTLASLVFLPRFAFSLSSFLNFDSSQLTEF
jgi:hypothetical protein